MDDETRAAFGRIDRYFELNQLQLAELRSELKGDIQHLRTELKAEIQGLRTELKAEIQGLRTELNGEIQGLRSELRSLRDWIETTLARIWTELRALTIRVARIEQRLDDTPRW